MITSEKNTKDKILDIAETLILTKGYSNFSYNDIAEIVGIRKASIHHHFHAKEDLGSEFIQRYRTRFKGWREMVEQKSPKEKIEDFFALYKMLSNNYESVCPVGMLTTEYPVLPEIMQTDLRELYKDIIDWLTNVVDEGKEKNEFNPDADSGVIANILLITLSGALKMSRIFKENFRVEPIINEIKRLIFIKG